MRAARGAESAGRAGAQPLVFRYGGFVFARAQSQSGQRETGGRTLRRLRQQIVEAIDEIVRPARGVGFAPDEIQKGEIENRLRGVRRRERRALAQIGGGRFPTQTQKPQITAVAIGGEICRLRFQNPRIQRLDRGRGFRRRRGVPARGGFVQNGVRVVGNLSGDFLESGRRFVEFFFRETAKSRATA